MPTQAEAEAIRKLMRDAAATGNTLSFHDAQRQLANPKQDLRQEAINKLFDELATAKARIESLTARFERLTIAGKEFSGQGEHIQFKTAPEADGSSTPMEIITISFCDEDLNPVTRQVYAVPE